MPSKTNIAATDPPAATYQTVRRAAALIGVKYHALLEAVKDGRVPSYKPFNSRQMVCLAEVEAVIRAYRQGGAQ